MKNILLLTFLCFAYLSYSQNNTGIGTSTPNANALLELQNNGNPLGLLLPRQDLATFSLGAMEAGMMVYNTADGKVYIWDGSNWISAASQWGISLGNIYNLNAGNVGIGTQTPAITLEVEGNDGGVGPANFGTAATGSMRLTEIGSTPALDIGIADDAFLGGWLQVHRQTDQSINYPLLLNPNGGNVGIGNVDPWAPLHLTTSEANRKIVLWQNTNNDHQFYGFGINAGILRYQVFSTADNHIFYAGSSSATSSELMRIQGNGNVGIGTSNPADKLVIATSNSSIRMGNWALNPAYNVIDLKGSNGSDYNILSGSLDQNLFINRPTGQGIYFRMNNVDQMVINSSGHVGIGNPTPGNRLTVSGGNIQMDGDALFGSNPSDNFIYDGKSMGHYTIGWFNDTWNPFGSTAWLSGYGGIKFFTDGNNRGYYDQGGTFVTLGSAFKPGGGAWAALSDRRLKQNIRPFEKGLNELLQINTVNFSYNETSGFSTDSEYTGIIAQELQKVLPEMVSDFEKDGQTYLSVDPSEFTFLLINAVKEQQAQIEELRNQNKEFAKQLKFLQETDMNAVD